jgi:hypothetical protein
MKLANSSILLAWFLGTATAFLSTHVSNRGSGSSLSMVLEKPKVKKIAKIESLKVESDHLIRPLKEVRTLLG